MLFLTLLCLFCAVVSAKRSAKKEAVFSSVDSSASSDVKVDILKAVVYNLPEECKKLNTMGSFDALSAKKYECMFVSAEEFKSKKPAAILALLMQRGEKKLVEAIARIWIEKRRWGPFNQAEIAADLGAILSVKKSLQFSKTGAVEIDDESIYQVFKVMLSVGEGLIVADSFYLAIIPCVFKLATDKSEAEYAKRFNLIMETFFIQSLPAKSGNKNTAVVDVKLLARVYSMTRSLNALAEKGKISREIWGVYAPVICSELNSRFATNFKLIEKQKKIKNGYDSSDSSSDEDDVSNGSVDAEEGKQVEKTETIKYIEICAETASETLRTVHSLRSEKVKSESSDAGVDSNTASKSAEEGSSMSVLMVIGGSVLVLAGVGFVAYSLMGKRHLRKSSTNSDLA